jgi:hypothetical protein
MRVFDLSSDRWQPWQPCNEAEASYCGRMPASILNNRLANPIVYDQGDQGGFPRGVGIVIEPEGLRYLCAWAADAVSMNKGCASGTGGAGANASCIPGCPPPACQCAELDTMRDPTPCYDSLAQCDTFYCTGVHDTFWWKCGWQGDHVAMHIAGSGGQLKEMMEQQLWRDELNPGGKHTYNEIVLDPASYMAPPPSGLPRVLAFFADRYGCWSSACRRRAMNLRKSFVESEGLDDEAAPMLQYDAALKNTSGGPFWLVSDFESWFDSNSVR